jgi:hypothetical protein
MFIAKMAAILNMKRVSARNEAVSCPAEGIASGRTPSQKQN